MNNDYKEYFNNINPSDELKNKILNKTIYKKNYNLKYIYATISIFIICFLTTTIIYADDIYNYIIEYHEKENYIEIKPPINYKLNTKATLLNCYTINDFENDLEIDLLESTMLDSTLKLDYKLYTTDNTLQRITLVKSINTKDYFDDLDYLQQNDSTIRIRYIMLTKHATNEQINKFNLTYEQYDEKYLEKIYNEKLKTYMYHYSNATGSMKYSIRSSINFIYEDVLYQIEGHHTSKDMLLTIANSFE